MKKLKYPIIFLMLTVILVTLLTTVDDIHIKEIVTYPLVIVAALFVGSSINAVITWNK